MNKLSTLEKDYHSPVPTVLGAGKVREWLCRAVAAGASDLHLIGGYPPVLRLHGELVPIDEPPLSGDAGGLGLAELLPTQVQGQLAQRDCDCAFEFPMEGQMQRFRANLFRHGGQAGACIRIIPRTIPSFDWASFPVALANRLTQLRDGLVFVTGATGSGKTTTLAMLVNSLNEQGGYRIITVEEPVEYHFPTTAHSVVTQREVPTDVASFSDGLKYGLRQDPDVILVGEIRDLETAQMALSAAETGHLVFATLHTRDAKGAVSRFTDIFPQEGQRDVRSQLALSLRAVVCQRLLPDVDPASKRHLALEVLWNTNPIASAIRTGRLESIDNYLLTNRDDGMVSFDESVRVLLRQDKITRAVAEQNVREVTYLFR